MPNYLAIFCEQNTELKQYRSVNLNTRYCNIFVLLLRHQAFVNYRVYVNTGHSYRTLYIQHCAMYKNVITQGS
jgi:hypothetical protein